MAISTVRPDGWPQTTVVGYANRGFQIFFLIFRASQKYANIQQDNRISIAVAPEPEEVEQLKAVYGQGELNDGSPQVTEGRLPHSGFTRQLNGRQSGRVKDTIPSFVPFDTKASSHGDRLSATKMSAGSGASSHLRAKGVRASRRARVEPPFGQAWEVKPDSAHGGNYPITKN
jgi:hypothetical protein